MAFRLSGLKAELFEQLFAKSDEELEKLNIRRMPAEAGFPCRVTLEDAVPGESVLLLPFEHQSAATPYRSSGPIFVREGDHRTASFNSIPEAMRGRLYSVRAYDLQGDIVDADVALGSLLEPMIQHFFAKDEISYLHVHHARRGCYAFRIDRA